MKINLTQTFKDLDGNPIRIKTGPREKDEKVATLALIVANSLLAEHQGENLSGETKIRFYDLAIKIYNASEIDLKTENIVDIKGRIEKTYGTLIVGQADKMLEGKK